MLFWEKTPELGSIINIEQIDDDNYNLVMKTKDGAIVSINASKNFGRFTIEWNDHTEPDIHESKKDFQQ
jgi:hypothetical protein